MFCYCHFEIKSRATCRPKSRCQSDLSTVSVLANKSLHQDLMHSGCRGTAVPNVCLQAFSLFPLPSSPLHQRPVHRLLSPVHFKLRTITNKKVGFLCHANRMKPFVDPNVRPIDPLLFDDPAEPYLDESDIPKDCFEPTSAEANPKDTVLKPVDIEMPPSLQPQKEKESDQEKTKNQLQNAKESTPEAVVVIDNETVRSAEKILKHRNRNGKVEYLVKWLNYPKNQSTWEPEHHILDRRLIDNYLQSQK